ncbi:50S ribosomal protein L17 [Candidatus Mycoplasma haematobovis]|uniref:50S ribosomal protein L17 n=1 Tax=Candidatus Mycoplasma haematobovis TaxID=432608 RepID=A0A1A9QEG1_9MOLU|nr:50S ribosomal protein L17 [Candidatus Mycoplasma haematobovis]OAL10391.1 50S ribosomal protein L17 [Candidatus Mycoplasma haematobovis]
MSFVNRKGRTLAHKKMVTRQQISDVLSYGYITTTKSYGKNTQRFLERLITLSKEDTLEHKREAASILLPTTKYKKDELLKKLFTEIATTYKNRNGGYSRLLKLREENRVILSLV